MNALPLSYFRNEFQFDASSPIGEGNYGAVYAAYDTFREETVAIKFYRGDRNQYDVYSELQKAVKLAPNPYVIRYHRAYYLQAENEKGEAEYFQAGVMEYASGGDLAQWIDSLSDPMAYIEQIQAIFRDILLGMRHLEKHGIRHGDIKPQNILLVSNKEGAGIQAKIGDFGLAESLAGEKGRGGTARALGSPLFMAPELNRKNFAARDAKGKAKILFNADLWSLGVLMYYVFTRRYPFKHKPENEPLKRVKSAEPAPWKHLPAPFSRAISLCLEPYAFKRIRSTDDLLSFWPKASGSRTIKLHKPTPRIKLKSVLRKQASPLPNQSNPNTSDGKRST